MNMRKILTTRFDSGVVFFALQHPRPHPIPQSIARVLIDDVKCDQCVLHTPGDELTSSCVLIKPDISTWQVYQT